MSGLPSTSDSSDDGYNSEEILGNWLGAVIELQTYYSTIYTYVTESTKQREQNVEETIYIGQCPVNQLEALLITIQGELEKLRQDIDIDQLDVLKQTSSKKNYTKLISHTLTLNRLNEQAKIRLHLASLPAS